MNATQEVRAITISQNRTIPSKRAALMLVVAMMTMGLANSAQIDSAIVDYVNKTITLSGNFGLAPVVTLGSVPLVVQASSATQVVADISQRLTSF